MTRQEAPPRVEVFPRKLQKAFGWNTISNDVRKFTIHDINHLKAQHQQFERHQNDYKWIMFASGWLWEFQSKTPSFSSTLPQGHRGLEICNLWEKGEQRMVWHWRHDLKNNGTINNATRRTRTKECSKLRKLRKQKQQWNNRVLGSELGGVSLGPPTCRGSLSTK